MQWKELHNPGERNTVYQTRISQYNATIQEWFADLWFVEIQGPPQYHLRWIHQTKEVALHSAELKIRALAEEYQRNQVY